MIELFKIFFVLGLAAYLIHKRVRVEHAIFLCSFVTGLLFGFGLLEVAGVMFRAFTDYKTLELACVVVLITFLGALLKHVESISGVVSALNGLFGDVRITLMGVPAFIGLLPMPGGAMVSAPFVEELGVKAGLSAEEKTLVNYWFRHVWEYCFPLYPAIILASVICAVPYEEIVVHLMPLSFAAILAGLFFIVRKINFSGLDVKNDRGFFLNLRVLLADVWPVAFVVAAVFAFKVNIVLALAASTALLALSRRVGFGDLSRVFSRVGALSLVVLVLSVMSFKAVVEETGAAGGLPDTFTRLGVPEGAIIFLVPFILGLLTGLGYGFVGVAFPIILPFMATGGVVSLDKLLLAYAGGLMGVYVSPVHLCFVLTREYFKADLRKTYSMLAKPVIAMTAVTIILSYT